EAVTMARGSSTVTIPKDGSAKVTIKATILVDDTWSVGFDQVYAEDVKTHYTASAQLQVVGTASSSPAHLDLLDQHGKLVTSLNFGSVIQGTNSILPLTLKNSGSGSITWSAGSDQPWLLVSPNQGTFSQRQTIDVAAQTLNLKPGMHTGTLTLSSNVSTLPQTIKVTVTVKSPGSGAVLAPTPAVLSFTTTDGSQARPRQVLTLDNPGNQTLNWSLAITASLAASNQTALDHIPGISNYWLSATPNIGSIPAHSSQQISVSVNSNSLLPGAYQGELLFSAPGAIDPTQTVVVSLTVQPHCGLVTNSGNLTFTAVQGQPDPGNQSLGLNATASCPGAPINWKATLSSSYNWLSATPTSGTLTGTTSEFVSIGANSAGLPANPHPYFGFIAFTTPNSTQTVMVQLTVQPPPQPGAPVMSAAPLNLNFSSTQGQLNPKGQVVTITNSGGSPLKWNTNVNIIVSSWLNVSPTSGVIPRGGTGQLVVNVDTSSPSLSPGSYAGQITINAQAPASGGGEVVSVNLVVQPPCTLTQPSSSSLAFSGVQGPYNPISQTVLITGTGNCAWPLAWTASVPTDAPWLVVNPPSNSIKASGQSSSFTVQPVSAGKLSAGVYTTTITISATDSAGTVAAGSPQQITATLSVLPPCLPAVGVSSLTFTAVQGQTSPGTQIVQLKESGTCARPVTWTATGDAGSSAWLSLSPLSPDTGSGTPLTVTVNSATLPAGTYKGTITLAATDNNGATVGSQTITVTLTVTPPPTYAVSGTVMACAGPAPTCPVPVPLPLATLTLFNSSNMQVAIITANASGNYTFTNLLAGTYTVTITGTDANNVQYLTTDSLLVTMNATNVTLQVYPV
ncbi:MAG TPA: carboxypeptidase-like regulatory domain-containing protein, partial [Ktedonobacteraceae bacterium]